MDNKHFLDEYVISKDLFGRTIIRRIHPYFILFLLGVVIILSIIIFPLLPFGLALWAWITRDSKKRFSTALLSLFVFLYMIFDLYQGWFVPKIFGKLNLYEMEFSAGVIQNPIPILLIYVFDLFSLYLNFSIINRYYFPEPAKKSEE